MAGSYNDNLTISPAGLALIKKWEGWYPKAYKDPVGVWTIGWGTIGAEAVPGRTITKKQGEVFLKRDLADDEETVKRLVKVKLTQHEFDALTSFVYNCGSGNFKSSTLLKLLNRGNKVGAAGQFIRWNKGRSRETGKWLTLPGLTSRRKDETALFLLPDEEKATITSAEVAQQRPMEAPNDHDGGVIAEAPEDNPNALQEIIKSSDTIKLLVVSVASLGAAVSSLLEPIKDEPLTALSLLVAALSLGAVFYVKYRDTKEGR
jgi:lysozyme